MAKKKKKYKIAVVAEDVAHGLVYQRLQMPLSRLNPDEFEIHSFDVDYFRHSDAIYMDAVVMCHPTRTNNFFEIAHRCRFTYRIPCILDLDDLLTNLQSDHPEFEHFQYQKIIETIKVSASVVVSTDYLLREWGHLNTNISVIENMIDTKKYDGLKPINKPYHSGFVVGWAGSQSHRSDQLYTFMPGLMKFMDEFDDVRCYFHILCPQILKDRYGARVTHEPKTVAYFDYDGIKAAYPIDVMLVGLYPHPFNEAKSDMKLLEMGPARIPMIASPRGQFKRHEYRNLMIMAEDNKTGHYGWYEALKMAYGDKDALKAYADNAYNYVMKERDIKLSTKAWKKVLLEAIDRYAPIKSLKF